jgi:hypothetical protein
MAPPGDRKGETGGLHAASGGKEKKTPSLQNKGIIAIKQ